MKIPRIIHLCWFSGDAFPESVQVCIDSWRRTMPAHDIRIWTAKDVRRLNNIYSNEALQTRKYAFAADVVRLYAVWSEGGIYLDSDVFLKQSLEPLLQHDFVTAHEHHPEYLKKDTSPEGCRFPGVDFVSGHGIQAAFFAAVPNHPFSKRLLDSYADVRFILPDGTLNTRILAPSRYAIAAESLGFRYVDQPTTLQDDVHILESRIVAGSIWEDSRDAVAVHCCVHSWCAKKSWFAGLKKFLRPYLNISSPHPTLEYVRKLEREFGPLITDHASVAQHDS